MFHPTLAEFADPLKYIASIRAQAEEYGICRVVPPEGWRAPFHLDPSTFSFKTRVQTVNELQLRLKKGKNRSFRTEYADYMASQGTAVTRWPVFGGKKLDLQALFDAVTTRGGFDAVCRAKQWRDIARVLDAPATVSSASFALRQMYEKWLLSFEAHKAAKVETTLSPAEKAKEAAAKSKEKEVKVKEEARRETEKEAAMEKQSSVKEEDLLEALFELGNDVPESSTPRRLKLEMVCTRPRFRFLPRLQGKRKIGRHRPPSPNARAHSRYRSRRGAVPPRARLSSSLVRARASPRALLAAFSVHAPVCSAMPNIEMYFFPECSCAGSGGGGAAAGGEAAAGSVLPQLRRQRARGVHDPLRRLRPRVRPRTRRPPRRSPHQLASAQPLNISHRASNRGFTAVTAES